MRRKARDFIPENILQAAHRAGLSTPLWYIGRTRGTQQPRQKTLAQLAAEGRKSALTATAESCSPGADATEPNTETDA